MYCFARGSVFLRDYNFDMEPINGDEGKRVMDGLRAKKRYPEIAAELKRPVSDISTWVYREVNNMMNGGKSVRDISREFGLMHTTTLGYRKKYIDGVMDTVYNGGSLPWARREDTEMAKLFAAGKPPSAIAETLQRPVETLGPRVSHICHPLITCGVPMDEIVSITGFPKIIITHCTRKYIAPSVENILVELMISHDLTAIAAKFAITLKDLEARIFDIMHNWDQEQLQRYNITPEQLREFEAVAVPEPMTDDAIIKLSLRGMNVKKIAEHFKVDDGIIGKRMSEICYRMLEMDELETAAKKLGKPAATVKYWADKFGVASKSSLLEGEIEKLKRENEELKKKIMFLSG